MNPVAGVSATGPRPTSNCSCALRTPAWATPRGVDDVEAKNEAAGCDVGEARRPGAQCRIKIGVTSGLCLGLDCVMRCLAASTGRRVARRCRGARVAERREGCGGESGE
jgi:hypothetical protein